MCAWLDSYYLVYPYLLHQFLLSIYNWISSSCLGPFEVTISSGNEEDRITVKPNTKQAQDEALVVPPTPTPETTTLHGETIILCPNASRASPSKLPTVVTAPQVFSNIATSSALLTLKNSFDYESTTEYGIQLLISGNGHSGSVYVKVWLSQVHDCLLSLSYLNML